MQASCAVGVDVVHNAEKEQEAEYKTGRRREQRRPSCSLLCPRHLAQNVTISPSIISRTPYGRPLVPEAALTLAHRRPCTGAARHSVRGSSCGLHRRSSRCGCNRRSLSARLHAEVRTWLLGRV